MFINKIINKINLDNVDEYINYMLNNRGNNNSFNKIILNKIDEKIKHTLIQGA